ncbi:MAG: hypothetical protein ACRELE_10350, partial [Gemmatimonadales bacterium]
MRDLLLLAVQLVVILAKLTRSGGVRSVIAKSPSLEASTNHQPPCQSARPAHDDHRSIRAR